MRKSPAARRAEIVARAASVALSEGLECVTLRRIGEELDVRPGLVSHYFPSAEELVAEAFGSAAAGELDALLPEGGADTSARERLARFLAPTAGPAWDDISRLWINARHLSRYRGSLRERVETQEADWRGRLTGLLAQGVERGEFRAEDPEVVAMQILVVLDGLGANAGADMGGVPAEVARMAFRVAECQLGLPGGALEPKSGT